MQIEHCSDAEERFMSMRLRIFDSGYARLDSSWSMRDVCSPYTRLYFAFDGEGWIRTQAGERALRAGRMYLIPSGLKFDYWCDRWLEKLYMHVILELPDGFDLLGGFADGLELPLPERLGGELRRAYRGGSMAAALRIKSGALEALAAFMDAYGERLRPISSYSPLTHAAFRVIKRELSSHLTLKDIAGTLGINPSTLGKRFRADTGQSVSDYMDSLLMQRLQRELLSGEATLAEIADELGFCDQFYMSRYFKKRQGETPSAYRRRLGGAV